MFHQAFPISTSCNLSTYQRQPTHCDNFQSFFPKMFNVTVTKFSMKRCLLGMPYDILFEIFRRLPKGKLSEISKLCLKLRNTAGDARLWKNVHIKYGSYKEPKFEIFAFEDLYLWPWTVKEIDLSQTQINPPVSLQTDQVIKVAKLNLSAIVANKVTIESILARYQCTELHLDYNSVDTRGRLMGIAPEAFSKQTALEVLSLIGIFHLHIGLEEDDCVVAGCHQWLAPVLSNLKNLKTLTMRYVGLPHNDVLCLVKSLPASLEKLFLDYWPEDESFFEALAGKTPKLKELEVPHTSVSYPSLLKFQFLEVLHIMYRDSYRHNSNMYECLMKFPALKIVYIFCDEFYRMNLETNLEKLKNMLEPHGIIVEPFKEPEEEAERASLDDNNLWLVSKSVKHYLS